MESDFSYNLLYISTRKDNIRIMDRINYLRFIAINQRLSNSDSIEGFQWDMQVVYSVPEMMAAQAAQSD